MSKSYFEYRHEQDNLKLRRLVRENNITRKQLVVLLSKNGKKTNIKNSDNDIIKRVNDLYDPNEAIKRLKRIKVVPRSLPNEPSERRNIQVSILMTISGKVEKKIRRVNVNQQLEIDFFKKSEIKKYITLACDQYTAGISNCTYEIIGKPYIGIYKKVPIATKIRNFLNSKMRETVPLNIDHLFKFESIKINMLDTNCVKSYLFSKYPKHKKAIMVLGNEKGVTNEELYNFCVKYNIKMYSQNLEASVIIKNDPINNSKMPRMYYIYYNNHIYPQKAIPQMYKSQKNNYDQIIYVEKCKQALIRLLDSGELPVHVSVTPVDNASGPHGRCIDSSGAKVNSFTHNNICYTGNDLFEESKKVLKLFGLQDKITPDINHNKVMALIEKKYNEEEKVKLNSFLPNHNQFIKSACAFTKGIIDENRPIGTIDKNNCYAWVLSQLPFLPTCNLMQHSIKTEFPSDYKIVDEYIYIATPIKSKNLFHKLLMPSESLYNGYYLNLLRNEVGVQFILKECIQGNKSNNIYNKIVPDIRQFVNDGKISQEFAKSMVNNYIGCTEASTDTQIIDVFQNIYSAEDIESVDGFMYKINKDYYMTYQTKKVYNVQTKKPIGIFIKDMAKYFTYKKIISMGIKAEDIIQIFVDSFTFYTDNIPNFNIEDHISPSFDGWKIEEFTNHHCKDLSIYNNNNLSFSKLTSQMNIKNQLIIAPAGSGKTYEIINKIIPSLGHNDYIVLLPTHDTRADYVKAKLTSHQVYQKYIYSNKIPSEQVIIIDEIGLYDSKGQLLIYKCAMAGKHIISVGDFEQLLPVKESSPFNNQSYLKSLYKNISTLDQNMRNNFTKQYYKQLRTTDDYNFLTDEVHKHSTKKYTDAEVIITYYTKTRDKYNALMLQHLGFTSQFEKGVRLQCISNDMYKKHEITNRMTFKIMNIKSGIFELKDELFGQIYKLTKKELKTHFRCAYAITLYAIQGKSVSSYYFPKEDNYAINNRSSYTIISRLKQDRSKNEKSEHD
jgi:AAA domain-containing protein